MTVLTVLVSLLVCGYSEVMLAHGGNLDLDGCHNNHTTGEYHCHRGPRVKQLETLPSQPGSIVNDADKSDPTVIAYNRDLYAYESYSTSTNRGFYTGWTCDTNIDHVVSLKDAHYSGAGRWLSTDRVKFANDKLNHVPACRQINSSKGSSSPSDFLRKGSDGEGLDYEVKPKCAYLGIYYQVKKKYQLSFGKNDPALFASCGLEIN